VSDSRYPVLYHAHHCLHQEDIPFWSQLAAKYPPPALELGCGTGRVTLALAQSGIRVFGIDKDFEMLVFLIRNLPERLSASVSILQGDFTHLHLAIKFGLIIMPCNTYSTLTQTGRLNTLRSVKRHLLPGGLFAISQPNPNLLAHIPLIGEAEIEETFIHPLSGDPVQVSSAWVRTSEQFTVIWHYDHLLPEGSVERLTHQSNHHILSSQKYLDEFDQEGFKVTQVLGEYEASPYSPDSPNLIILATHKQPK
jgi:SAM-dependent methyltransferase